MESGGNDNGSDDHDCGLDGNEDDGGNGKMYFWKIMTQLSFLSLCRAARIVAALQPGCEEMKRE